jgi:hypothetical protein
MWACSGNAGSTASPYGGPPDEVVCLRGPRFAETYNFLHRVLLPCRSMPDAIIGANVQVRGRRLSGGGGVPWPA